jgi:hypothetical protein
VHDQSWAPLAFSLMAKQKSPTPRVDPVRLAPPSAAEWGQHPAADGAAPCQTRLPRFAPGVRPERLTCAVEQRLEQGGTPARSRAITEVDRKNWTA